MTSENSLKQPEKKETLASKEEKRRQRLNHLRGRWTEFSAQWWVGAGEIIGIITLFLINFYLLYPFFGQGDQVNVFSAPVIPALATLTERFVPFAYGVRIWLLAFLLFFPLSFYFFAREISGRKLIAFLASFVVILPLGVFLPARVKLGLLSYQDGAHVASLTITPLVCLLLLRFLRRGHFWTGIFAALGTALVALTSPVGFLGLTTFMTVITFSEMLLGNGRIKLFRVLVVFFLAMGFSAFWYHPKFVFLTIDSPQGELIKETFANLLPVSFFVAPLLGVFGFLLFEDRPQLQSMFIAFFLAVGFGLFSLGAGVAHPTPSRFLPAFGLSLAFLLGVFIVWLFDFLRTSPKLKRFKTIFVYRRLIAFALIGFVFLLIFVVMIFSYRSFWELGEFQVLGLTAEQKVGVWEIREKTTQLESVFGYTITGLTAFGLVILKARLGM